MFGEKVEDKAGSKYPTFGINDYTIKSIVGGTTPNGADKIDVTIFPKGGSEDATTSLTVYMSAAAMPKSMLKLKHLSNRIVKEVQFDNAQMQASNHIEMAEELDKLLSGNSVRLKLKGKEYLGTDKEGNPKVKVALELPLPDFAEAIQNGAEKPMVTDIKLTALKFDKTNSYDYEVYEGATPDAETAGAPASRTF